MINEKDLFEQFRGGTDLEACYSLLLTRRFEEEAKRKSDPVSELFAAVEICTKVVGNVPYKAMKDPETKAKIIEALIKLENVISDIKP